MMPDQLAAFVRAKRKVGGHHPPLGSEGGVNGRRGNRGRRGEPPFRNRFKRPRRSQDRVFARFRASLVEAGTGSARSQRTADSDGTRDESPGSALRQSRKVQTQRPI